MVKYLAIFLLAVSCLGQSLDFHDQPFLSRFIAGPTNITYALVLWWPMAEGQGTNVADWSPKGNNGVFTVTNPPSWVAGVGAAHALSFVTNTGNGVKTANNPDLSFPITSGTTVTWWCYQPYAWNNNKTRLMWSQYTNTANQTALSCTVYLNNQWYVGWSNGSFDRRMNFANSADISPQNTWVWYAWVNCEPTIYQRFYTNGVPAANYGQVVGNIAISLPAPFYIGGQQQTGDPGFGGSIGEFRVYTNFLSDAQILYLYHTYYGQP